MHIHNTCTRMGVGPSSHTSVMWPWPLSHRCLQQVWTCGHLTQAAPLNPLSPELKSREKANGKILLSNVDVKSLEEKSTTLGPRGSYFILPFSWSLGYLAFSLTFGATASGSFQQILPELKLIWSGFVIFATKRISTKLWDSPRQLINTLS